ncbi:MAG: CHAT domain-containing protein [Acidobacteriota bacterium]
MKDFPLDFQIEKDSARGAFVVHLAAGSSRERADFAYQLANPRLRRVQENIEQNVCRLDELRDIGTNLWAGLMAGQVGELFETVRQGNRGVRFQFRLNLPAELEPLPWESLYHERDFGFVSSHRDHVILRLPPDVIDAPAAPPQITSALRILVVIPMGSGLGTDTEMHNLRVAVGSVGDSVLLDNLAGRVTPDALENRLRDGRWDVLHFIGHGELGDNGRTKVRLNSPRGEDSWMDGEVFAEVLRGSGVRLAVLNCCEGARPMPGQSLSGLGPLLLRAGVPAVVAMRYEIHDDTAILFSEQFYRALLNGPAPGRVDLALEQARRAIYLNQNEHSPARGFITPVLFLAPSCEQLFRIENPEDTGPGPEAITGPTLDLPQDLLDALLDGRCVPVVGQGTLAVGTPEPAVRSRSAMAAGAEIPGPRQLAEILRERFQYPHEKDFSLSAMAGDWMDLLLLQWICQHFVATHQKDYFKLIQFIQSVYAQARPPACLAQIAEWDVPGIFCLYFDGLLAQAFAEANRPTRSVNAPDEAAALESSLPLLVHVRGTHKFVDSLVLTEQDHDELWDRLGRMSQAVTDLVRGFYGRSLLFLGASPRDPLVKRLAAKLLEQVPHKKRGPMFFVCSKDAQKDPYWDTFSVTWIEGELTEIVLALTNAVRQGKAR